MMSASFEIVAHHERMKKKGLRPEMMKKVKKNECPGRRQLEIGKIIRGRTVGGCMEILSINFFFPLNITAAIPAYLVRR